MARYGDFISCHMLSEAAAARPDTATSIASRARIGRKAGYGNFNCFSCPYRPQGRIRQLGQAALCTGRLSRRPRQGRIPSTTCA